MAKFLITVQAQQVEARIKELQGQGADLTPAWSAVGAVLVNRIRLGFRFSRDPWGNSWLPIKWRAPRVAAKSGRPTKHGRQQIAANVAGTPGQPLVDKGLLRRSITFQADAKGVTVGTNLIYARTHQFGAHIRPKKGPFLVFPGPDGRLIFSRGVTVPARPFLPLNPAGGVHIPPLWAKNIVATLAKHFNLSQQAVPA